jgi:uncharacterized protein (DUF4415 family)
VEHFAVYYVRTYMYLIDGQMKRKKRVKRRGQVASLRASASVEQGRSANDGDRWREWRERQLELKRWHRLPKKRVTLNLDADVLAWFRGMGRGYQWEINKALRRVMEGEMRALNGKH